MTVRTRKRGFEARTFGLWAMRVVALAITLPAAEASACAVCAAAMPVRTLHAYVGLTVGLSLLPMALSVVVFLALRRQASQASGDDSNP